MPTNSKIESLQKYPILILLNFMNADSQNHCRDSIFELVGIFITISSYSTITWTMCQFFESIPWCIWLGLLYYVVNIYFVLTMSDKPVKDEENSIILQSKPFLKLNYIVAWSSKNIAYLLKAAYEWAKEHKFIDFTIRLVFLKIFIAEYENRYNDKLNQVIQTKAAILTLSSR